MRIRLELYFLSVFGVLAQSLSQHLPKFPETAQILPKIPDINGQKNGFITTNFHTDLVPGENPVKLKNVPHDNPKMPSDVNKLLITKYNNDMIIHPDLRNNAENCTHGPAQIHDSKKLGRKLYIYLKNTSSFTEKDAW